MYEVSPPDLAISPEIDAEDLIAYRAKRRYAFPFWEIQFYYHKVEYGKASLDAGAETFPFNSNLRESSNRFQSSAR